MSEANKHWLVFGGTGFECQGCDWTGKQVQEFWDAHEIEVSEPAF